MMPMTRCLEILALLALFAATGCGHDAGADPDHDHEPAAAPTNRIAVPAAVRQNLGITFATVERRRVAATLRLPGSFELLPTARADHVTPVAGRVTLRVQALQPVAAGDVLYTIDSPEWRKLQRDLGELAVDVLNTTTRMHALQPLLEAHHAHEQSLRSAVTVLEQRIATLETMQKDLGGHAPDLAEARVQLAQVHAQHAEAAEQHTEAEVRISELATHARAAGEQFDLLLAGAAALVGLPVATLAAPPAGAAADAPSLWRTLAAIEVRAAMAGVVADLPVASGSWVEPGALVVAVRDPRGVRFRASALQSDLAALPSGEVATIVAPGEGPAGANPLPPARGPLQIGLEADPQQRTVQVFVVPTEVPDWARPGVAAFVEVETRAGGERALAVPLAAVMQDGLERVLFRRDTKDPDQVVRIAPHFGVDDGRWIEVRSDLTDGDEVVVRGAYALVLASSATAAKGGHFHADGSFHAEDHK